MRGVAFAVLLLALVLAAGTALWLEPGEVPDPPPDLLSKLKPRPPADPYFKFVIQAFGLGPDGEEFCTSTYVTPSGVRVSKTTSWFPSIAAARRDLRRLVEGSKRVSRPTTCLSPSNDPEERAVMLEEFRDGQTWFNLTWLKEKERYSIESLSRDGVLAFVSEICRPDAEPAP